MIQKTLDERRRKELLNSYVAGTIDYETLVRKISKHMSTMQYFGRKAPDLCTTKYHNDAEFYCRSKTKYLQKNIENTNFRKAVQAGL